VDKGNPAAIPEDQVAAWVRSGAIEWWGHRTDMPAVFQSCSIVCLPSYAEGVPRSLIEAAATGRAIVASDVAGCREVVSDGVNGFLVPPRDADRLAAAIARLLREPNTRMTFGREGRSLAERKFSIEFVARATVDIYNRLMTSSPLPTFSS
jgi:glycosyltransferase involved in cell wall biosynthesis